MQSTLRVSLVDVYFRAFHGLYPEEKLTGNDFIVNLQVEYEAPQKTIVEVSETIDYAALFSIVKEIMQSPVDLLETLVQTIAAAVKEKYPQITAVNVSVEKRQPPIEAFQGSTKVGLQLLY